MDQSNMLAVMITTIDVVHRHNMRLVTAALTVIVRPKALFLLIFEQCNLKMHL